MDAILMDDSSSNHNINSNSTNSNSLSKTSSNHSSASSAVSSSTANSINTGEHMIHGANAINDANADSGFFNYEDEESHNDRIMGEDASLSRVPSASSMIFERNVEDPYSTLAAPLAPTTGNNTPRTLSRTNSLASLSRTGSNISFNNALHAMHPRPPSSFSYSSSYHHHHNRTLENLIPPALDASCSIVGDKNTNLDQVHMVYSRRPSTIGLDMALKNPKSAYSNSSFTNLPSLQRSQTDNKIDYLSTPPTSPTDNLLPGLVEKTKTTANNTTTNNSNTSNNTNTSGVDPNTSRPKVLKFYSYADMLSDENNANGGVNGAKRLSISRSPSSVLLMNSPPNSSSASFKGFVDPFGTTNNNCSSNCNNCNPVLLRKDSNNSNVIASPHLTRKYSGTTNPPSGLFAQQSPRLTPSSSLNNVVISDNNYNTVSNKREPSNGPIRAKFHLEGSGLTTALEGETNNDIEQQQELFNKLEPNDYKRRTYSNTSSGQSPFVSLSRTSTCNSVNSNGNSNYNNNLGLRRQVSGFNLTNHNLHPETNNLVMHTASDVVKFKMNK
ncbi:uncharacterized protein SCODWIG_03891 [Saccharomycodes ludwigii]|uniref:Uncharacterized protein n=1 Tax=Saccharomycodes ludwigii TaxID=36035 RepID=A0A376BC12_9ASCO|nr:hypothetical protein SCDLUD_002819 [Saccharomycodes ludwigii]KAH3901328.1 hypothetical protein SCDLUD_002819 [Saccharomycodes ludwigii]SSD62129.1 uncharacterized protein SCODWIG_03891 [Saccharomycodes ludwigii]